jgi:hypothetical protein
MSKLASLSLLALLAVAIVALPTAPVQAQGCPVGAAAPVGCPPPPPPPPPGNNPGSPGDPFTPVDTVAEVLKNMLIACRVSGTPSDLPNDIKFRNIGELTIPSGTRIYWMIKETGDHGIVPLKADLPVGESVTADGLLKVGVPKTDHCYSKIM